MSAISGAAARIYFRGEDGQDKLAGRATGVSATENIEQVAVQVLGEIDVVEHEPVSRTVSVTADFVRIKKKSLTEQGIFPRGDTVEVLNFPEMTWVLYDITTDEVIWTIDGVVPETRTWRVDQGSIMTVNCTFRARRMYDEQDS